MTFCTPSPQYQTRPFSYSGLLTFLVFLMRCPLNADFAICLNLLCLLARISGPIRPNLPTFSYSNSPYDTLLLRRVLLSIPQVLHTLFRPTSAYADYNPRSTFLYRRSEFLCMPILFRFLTNLPTSTCHSLGHYASFTCVVSLAF